MAEADYNNLKVAELKELLQERGLTSSGNKAALICRLQDNDVKPEDSASQAHSSTTSSRIKATARKAAALAKLKLLDRKHALQLEQLNASRDLERLELEIEMEAAAAEEEVYTTYEETASHHALPATMSMHHEEAHLVFEEVASHHAISTSTPHITTTTIAPRVETPVTAPTESEKGAIPKIRQQADVISTSCDMRIAPSSSRDMRRATATSCDVRNATFSTTYSAQKRNETRDAPSTTHVMPMLTPQSSALPHNYAFQQQADTSERDTALTQQHARLRDNYTTSATISDTAIVSIGSHVATTNVQSAYSRPIPSPAVTQSMLWSSIKPPPGFYTPAVAAHQTYNCSAPMVGSVPCTSVGETLYSTLNPSAPAWQQSENVVASNGETLRYPTNNDTNFSFIQQQHLLDAMSIPKPKLMSFNGDPMNFHVFMNAFDNCIHTSSLSDAIKLNKLFELCEGKALTVIKPCALMQPVEGYVKARLLLKERFGNDFVISEAWVNKITCDIPVKPNSAESLQEFADDVRGCVETLRAMNRLDEVDTRGRLVKLMNRLPLYLQGRWRKEAVTTCERTGRYPNIDAFLKFLERLAREASDPVFGYQHTQPAKRDTRSNLKHRNANRGTSFSVTATDQLHDDSTKQIPRKLTCRMCEGDHAIYQCEQFKSLKPEARLSFAKENRICFNCLKVGKHAAKECHSRYRCKVQGCQMKHSSLLHHAFKFQNPNTDETEVKHVDTNARHSRKFT